MVKKSVFFILKLLGIVCFFILMVFLFPKYSNVFGSVFTLLIMVYSTAYLLKFVSWGMMKLECKKLNKLTTNKKQNLYLWASKDDVDKLFTYKLLTADADKNTLGNLKEIRTRLKDEVGQKIEDYYLLKNYLEVYEKNNIFEKFTTVFLGLIVTTIAAVVTKIGTSESVIKKIVSYFLGDQTQSTLGNPQTIVDVFTIVLIVVLLIVFIISEFSREKRRNELIKSVIDSIIFEKQKG